MSKLHYNRGQRRCITTNKSNVWQLLSLCHKKSTLSNLCRGLRFKERRVIQGFVRRWVRDDYVFFCLTDRWSGQAGYLIVNDTDNDSIKIQWQSVYWIFRVALRAVLRYLDVESSATLFRVSNSHFRVSPLWGGNFFLLEKQFFNRKTIKLSLYYSMV